MTSYDQIKYALKLHRRLEHYKELGIDVSMINTDDIETTLRWLDGLDRDKWAGLFNRETQAEILKSFDYDTLKEE